jgi:hypothetical protein
MGNGSAVPSSAVAAIRLAGGSSSRAGLAAAPSAERCSPPSAHVHAGGVGVAAAVTVVTATVAELVTAWSHRGLT